MLRLGLVILALMMGATDSARAGTILAGWVVDARLCEDPECDTVTMTLETENPAPAPLMGILQVDGTVLRIEFDLTLESALLRGTDGNWLGLGLQDMRFQGSFGLSGFGSVPITGGTAQVDGTAMGVNPLALSASIPFSATPALSGIGRLRPGIGSTPPGGGFSSYQIVFGPGEFAIPFDGGRFLEITLAASAPEPSALVLVVLGVAAAVGLRTMRA